MRKIFLLIVLLWSCFAFGSTYEMRSDKHALSVSVRETGDLDVRVEVMIDRTGAVTGAHILKALPYGLGEAAVEAVRQWKFKPGTLNGMPVDVIFNLTVNFKPEAE